MNSLSECLTKINDVVQYFVARPQLTPDEARDLAWRLLGAAKELLELANALDGLEDRLRDQGEI